MNDTTDPVQKVKSHQNLSGDLLDQIQRQSFIVVPFQDLEQVNTQNFKHHAEVVSVRSFIQERVQQIKHVTVIPVISRLQGLVMPEGLNPFRVIGLLGDFLQNFNLIV